MSTVVAPTSPLYVMQNQEVKYCKGCHIGSLKKSDYDVEQKDGQNQYRVSSGDWYDIAVRLRKNKEISNYEFLDHIYLVPHKISCVVYHFPNHPDCYNFQSEKMMSIFEIVRP